MIGSRRGWLIDGDAATATTRALELVGRTARIVAGGRTLLATDHERIVEAAVFFDAPGAWSWASAALYVAAMARRVDSGAQLDFIDVVRLRAIAENVQRHLGTNQGVVAA